MIWLDFETRSHCDLPKHGVYNYAQDATTEVLCMSYAVDDDDVQTWLPHQPLPDFHQHQIRAHNAAFERLIFWYILQQNYPLEQFYCTATQARANCAPGSLEDAGRFAGAGMRKDHRGAALIRKMSIPPYEESPELTAEMVSYCEQDVRAMRAISQSMRQLSAQELADYHVNERINDRGVLVDVPLANAAVRYSDAEVVDIQITVQDITHGEIASVRSPKMREWVKQRVGPEAVKLMFVGDKYSIDKTVRANLLAMDNPEEVPPEVAEVIQCADDLWASSVAKFKRMVELSDIEDCRVRGAFVFNGGSATGRASSYGAQVHNFTRKTHKAPEAVRQTMLAGGDILAHGARVTDVLKGMLRPAIIPAPGKMLVVADYAAIEARMNPWLSAHPLAESKLDLFRRGEDVYVAAACRRLSCTPAEVSPAERQIEKIKELACGFAGGVGAFAAMGRAYGVTLPEVEARQAVHAWRVANPWAVHYWGALEHAYTRAMRNIGKEFLAGRVTYMFDGQHLWYSLPSGRVLCYPHAQQEKGEITYAKAAWKPAQDATEWPRAHLWPGLACENTCSGAANDILRDALRQLPDVVLHVHDEIVTETDNPERTTASMQRIMTTPPAWAADLPLAVEIKTMPRYGK